MPYAGSGAAALQTAVAWRAAEADRLVHDGQRSRNAASARRTVQVRREEGRQSVNAPCAINEKRAVARNTRTRRCGIGR